MLCEGEKPTKARREHWIHGVKVLGSCKPPKVDSWNQAWAF